MASSIRSFLLLAVFAALFSFAGCAAPCDRYCDSAADYIEFCMAEASQGEWTTISTGAAWGYWGSYTSKEEYVADCQTDFDAQLAGAADSSVLTGACTDDANEFDQMTDRGQCGDVP